MLRILFCTIVILLTNSCGGETKRIEQTKKLGDASIAVDSAVAVDAAVEDHAMPGEKCCCQFIVPGTGDIMDEDLLAIDDCAQQERGECVVVDPGRLTPHPCCPQASGATCGG